MIHVDEEDPVGEIEPSFSHRDVTFKRGVDAEDFYELLSEVGRGKFGTVYHCKEKATGLELAAKFVAINRRDDRRNVEREVDVMRQLQHPRLIQLYDAFDSGKMMCVILELITGGELFERVIDDDFVLTEKSCTVFMRQICEGIEFVHQQNILHLDMKPENILCLTKSGNRIKIIDFGLARKFDPSKKLQVLFGTPEFVAPEVVNFDQIGFGTDMWSIGVICYVLLSGLSPFMGETDVETMANVTVAKYDFDDEAFNEISEDAKDFIKKLLVKDKQGRMTAQQCVAHPWLHRRPPSIQDKKKEVPEPDIILETLKPPPEKLDVTKDNLRMFVERWNEHPNSPYVFDVSAHVITPCMSRNNCNGLDTGSEHSIGGCSPSPCASLSSLTDSIFGTENHALAPGDRYSQNEYDDNNKVFASLHGLERRASDSSCFVNKKADICLRVNLAEEIKKLSDRLYMLSTINTDLVNNNVESYKTDTTTSTETTNNVEKSLNGLNSKISSNVIYNNCTKKTVSSTKNFTTPKEKYSSITKNDKNPNAEIIKNGVNRAKSFNVAHLNKFEAQTLDGRKISADETDSEQFSNLPWARRKFKVSNFSRDVPLSPERKKSVFNLEFNKRREKMDNFANSNGATCSDNISKTKHFYKKTDENGDVKSNANNTKDLLLHLLDQWGDSQTPTNDLHSGRHKSVSMEWSEGESIASKSMNTLNTFFKRQSSSGITVKKKLETFTSNGIK
ncbi:spaghetti-squash activator isoform X2 [Arctopsyche grandis]